MDGYEQIPLSDLQQIPFTTYHQWASKAKSIGCTVERDEEDIFIAVCDGIKFGVWNNITHKGYVSCLI